MSLSRRRFAAQALALPFSLWAARALGQARPSPVILASGGARPNAPALSAPAFAKAADEGADFLAGGLVPTKDGLLVVREDNELSAATDVANRPEYGERRATRVIDGQTREGWFTEDFTVAELKSLNLVGAGRPGRNPAGRPTILTLDDLIGVARAACVRQARVVGVVAVLKHPAYFANLDLEMESKLAQAISRQGYDSPAAALFAASEDPRSLTRLAGLTRARRMQIAGTTLTGEDTLAPQDLQSPQALAALAGRVTALAAPADRLLNVANPKAPALSDLGSAAQSAHLPLIAWTEVPGLAFPPPPLRANDTRRLMASLFAMGMMGVWTDQVSLAVRARNDAESGRK